MCFIYLGLQNFSDIVKGNIFNGKLSISRRDTAKVTINHQ